MPLNPTKVCGGRGEALTLSPPPDKRPLKGELEPSVMVFPPPFEYADALVLLVEPERLKDLAPFEPKKLEDAPWDFALLELELDEDPPFPRSSYLCVRLNYCTLTFSSAGGGRTSTSTFSLDKI